MGRAPCCDKANVKRGPWSPEEDAILKNFLEKNGTGGNWIALPQKAGLRRCGKSCRLRWLNYLRPDIKHGGFSEEEDNIICSLYSSIGSRWSIIAARLPGRTDNDIKNYWNTRLKKKLLGKAVKDDEQTRRFLAKEAAAKEIRMRYSSSNANNINNNASEANISASNSSSSDSMSVTDPVQQSLNSPYALDSSNVSILFKDPSSSASAESPLPKTDGFDVSIDHYERAFKQISDYSSFTNILTKALESNNRTECSTRSVSSHISPPVMNDPSEAQDSALYAQKLVNIKSEINVSHDHHHHPLSMPIWETSTSSGLWMGDVNNSQEYTNISSGDQLNELFYFNNSMPMKEESIYGVTTNPDSSAYWVSQLSANSASDPKSSYSYILLPEGNNSKSNTSSQEIFQEGIIY